MAAQPLPWINNTKFYPRPLQGKTLYQTSSDFWTTDSTKSYSQSRSCCDVCAKIDNHQPIFKYYPQPRRYRIDPGGDEEGSKGGVISMAGIGTEEGTEDETEEIKVSDPVVFPTVDAGQQQQQLNANAMEFKMPVVKNDNFEILSRGDSFVHIQHNIGSMSYFFKTPVYVRVGPYTNIVKNKMAPNDVNRTISNYLTRTKQAQYPPADLYTLQEVQEQDEKGIIDVNSETYGYVYKRTGHLFFAKENSILKIDHGCAVVYNKKRFSVVNINIVDYNPADDNIRERSTPWVFLRDLVTNKIYAVLSLHGIIPSGSNNPTKAVAIYNSLKRYISTIFTNFQINIIIGCDLNINIFTPNLNPFNISLSPTEKQYLNQILVPEIQSLLKFMRDRDISSVTDGTLVTNYSYHVPYSFEESLDFIFNSNLYIIKDTLMSIHRGGLLDLENTQQLIDDFDHSMLIVTCLDKDIIEDLNILSWSLGLPFSVDDGKKMSWET